MTIEQHVNAWLRSASAEVRAHFEDVYAERNRLRRFADFVVGSELADPSEAGIPYVEAAVDAGLLRRVTHSTRADALACECVECQAAGDHHFERVDAAGAS